MNLILSADWALDDAARAWLPGYVRQQFDEALTLVNKCFALLNRPLLSMSLFDVLIMELTVHLRGEGYRHAGYTSPGDGVHCRVDVLWGLEVLSWPPANERHTILFHEFGKLIVFTSYGAGTGEWAKFGNGKADDLIIIAAKTLTVPAFHGDVTLHHKDVVGPL